MLNWLHAALLRLLSIPIFSLLTGFFVKLKRPKWLIQLVIHRYFLKKLKVNTDEIAKSPAEYDTILSFFTRELKPGVRPLAGPENALISPVDAKVYSQGRIESGKLLQVKNSWYNLSDLLSPDAAGMYANGRYLTLYLSPSDYHRIHHPLSAAVTHIDYFPGRLLPVNDFSTRTFQEVFCRNKRVSVHYKKNSLNLVMVLVGALNVGAISISFDPAFDASRQRVKVNGVKYYTHPYETLLCRKGAEAAVFNLGSTVILIAPEHGLTFRRFDPGARVKMGQQIGALTV